MAMKKYVRLENNRVAEVFLTELDIKDLFHPSVKWDLCTAPQVQVGWIYDKGNWIDPANYVDVEALERNERGWRDIELVRADYELNKVQDSDPKSVGTVGDWRAYRKALRGLTEMEGFPVSHVRPVAPDNV